MIRPIPPPIPPSVLDTRVDAALARAWVTVTRQHARDPAGHCVRCSHPAVATEWPCAVYRTADAVLRRPAAS